MKYMGSKNRFSKFIAPILEECFKSNNCEIFIDACCGGANLIDKINLPNKYACDINPYLISMWRGLQKGNQYPDIIDRDLYNSAREIFNKKMSSPQFTEDLIGWIGYMASYNGRFFDGGYAGHCVKTKQGTRDYVSENIRNIKLQIPKIKDVVFTCKSLFEINPQKHALIYFDIPYKDTKEYGYSKDFDYDGFYQKCRELRDLGHFVFVSEYNMPENFTKVWEIETKTHMNKKAESRTEKLFTLD